MTNHYNVRISVELKNGQYLSIEAGGTSQDWLYLQDMPKDGRTLDLTSKPFQFDDLISDLARYTWNGTDLDINDEPVPIDAEAIVIVLESPHEKEYEDPKGPLKADGNVRSQLPRLLKDLGVPAGRQVGFCNPIRFQTSLHRYMNVEGKRELRQGVRDPVWTAAWKFDNRGRKVFAVDFFERMLSYKPSLVLNGCTSKLKKYVDEVAPWLCCPVVKASQHPSVWSRYTTLTVDPTGFAWGWLAKRHQELVRAIGWLRLESPTDGVRLTNKALSVLWSQSLQEWQQLAAEVAQHTKLAGASVPRPQWKQP